MKIRIIQEGRTKPKYKLQRWGKNGFGHLAWFDLCKKQQWERQGDGEPVWYNSLTDAESSFDYWKERITREDAELADQKYTKIIKSFNNEKPTKQKASNSLTK